MLFVLTGPESTAKSALTRQLAAHFKAPWIDEVARTYLQAPDYLPSDLLAIAELQYASECSLTLSPAADDLFGFADTDLQVLYIWWQEKYGVVPTALATAYACLGRRHYLLCEPDIAWTEDPLRENPEDRERLVEVYRADLEVRKLPFSSISGQGDQRLECAINAVTRVLAR